jgi:hypothetical protein
MVEFAAKTVEDETKAAALTGIRWSGVDGR